MPFPLARCLAPWMAGARGLDLPPVALREVERLLDLLLGMSGSISQPLTVYNGGVVMCQRLRGGAVAAVSSRLSPKIATALR